jgi:hypothetical protein
MENPKNKGGRKKLSTENKKRVCMAYIESYKLDAIGTRDDIRHLIQNFINSKYYETIAN